MAIRRSFESRKLPIVHYSTARPNVVGTQGPKLGADRSGST